MFDHRNHLVGTLILLALSFLAVVLHIGLVSFFPYPINKINLILLYVIMILLITESGRVVWISFVTYFLIELFSVTPFGVVLYSGTISALIFYWLYKSIFTNRSIFTTMSLAAISIFVYRFLYSILLFTNNYFNRKEGIVFTLPASSYAWESFITVITAALVHYILKFFIPKLNTARIRK